MGKEAVIYRIKGKLAALLMVCFVCLSFCAVPRAEAGLFSISTEEEISIGKEAAKSLEKQYGLVQDAALQERIAGIGSRLVQVSDRQGLPYTFKVLNSKEVNALALPGGFIYVFKGLIDKMPSDDELAGILGHELGHVVKRHSVNQMEKSMGMSLLFGIAFGDRGGLLQSLAQNAIMAKYSRDDESEADRLGFVHSFRAGYNPYGMKIGLLKLSEMDQNYSSDLFSDHPESVERVKKATRYLEEAKVHPKVEVVKGNAARIVDANLQLPPLYGEFNQNKPVYRAYFAAGILYRLAQKSDFDKDHFVLDADSSTVTVYYDDQAVITLTNEDAAGNGVSLMELSDTYIVNLKSWAESSGK